MIEAEATITLSSQSVKRRAAEVALAGLRPIAVVALALLIGMAIIVYTGENPFPAYENLLVEPFLSWDSFSSVLFYAIPLVLTGLAATVSFRASIFNLGGEGQLQLGAVATAWAAITWSGIPAIVLVPAVVVFGALAGALWASIAGWLRAYLGATELVSTIMLNYVAYDVVSYLVSTGGPLHNSQGSGDATNPIPIAAQIPTIGGSQFHWGFLVALGCVVVVFVLLYRTPLGYEIRMAGFNPAFARFGGIAVPRVIMGAMLISGALAGIAGAIQVLGFQYQYSTDFLSPQWGFTGVTVALLARLEPIGVVAAALLYALLEEGSQLIENNTNVDHNIITVVQGLIILFVTVQFSWDWFTRRRRANSASAQSASGT
jgi:general nucleoside transport system permease protein